MMAGLLPQISQTLGQSVPMTAQGITAFSLTYLFSAPLFSLLSKSRSQKKTLLLALTIFLLGNLITVFATHFWVFLFGRVLAGLGAGIFNPLAVGIALQTSDPTKKGKTLSLIWGANSAGVVFGVPLGVYIAEHYAWQISIGMTVVLGSIVLIGCLLSSVFKSKNIETTVRDRLKLLKDKGVLATLSVTALTCLITTGLYSYISAFKENSPHSLATIVLVWGIGGVAGSSFIGHIVDRTKNPQGVMAFLLFFLSINFLVLPMLIEHSIVGLIPFLIWGAFGWATITPQQYSLFEKYENMRPMLSALNSSAIGLGGTIGTALGGLLIGLGVSQTNLLSLSSLVLALVLVIQFSIMKLNLMGGSNEKNYSHC